MPSKTKIYTLNAAGQSLGRLASETASLLRGKREVDFSPNKVPNVKVKITNAPKVALTGNKWSDKEYLRYSGWPGGLKKEKAEHLAVRRGAAELLRRAVTRMLSRNKLRRHLLRNLEIE